jgi:hypothetical protein
METTCCPSCGSGDTYFSRKRTQWICEDCKSTFTASREVSGQKLFFSYGHDSNSEIVLRLKRDLEARGHSVWLDTSQIRAGDDWRLEITSGIMSADRVVSFLSRHSVRTPGVCLDELRIALTTKSGSIQSVLLEAEDDVAVPASLSSIQWLDMSNWRVQQADLKAFETWYGDRFRELCDVIESAESMAFAGDITSLRWRLHPRLSDSKERYLLSQPFVGRKWLVEQIRTWLADDQGPRAFVLLGGPGVGKSRLSAELLHNEPACVSGLFLEWDKELSSAKEVTRTLAFKLAARLADYRKLLITQLGDATWEELDRDSDSALFNRLIAFPLSQLVDGGRERLVIILDGLDEAALGSSNSLARAVAMNLKHLPRWITMFLTSRPEADVPALFADLNPTILDPVDDRSIQDVSAFLALRLKTQLVSSNEPHFLLQRLTESCQGNFLHATMLAEAAQSGRLTLEEAASLPPGLDGYYLGDFQRRFPSAEGWRDVRLFMEVLVSLQPAPIQFVQDTLGVDSYEFRERRLALGSLLSETDSAAYGGTLKTIGFSHKSVADWLDDSKRSGRFHIDRNHGLDTVCRALLAALSDPAARLPSSDPLASFLRSTVTHALALASKWPELEAFLLDEGTPLSPYWWSMAELPSSWDKSTLLDRLRNHEGRDLFLRELQRQGSPLLLDVIGGFADRWGARTLDLPLVNMYIDSVHLSGGYEQAVGMCDAYLQGREKEEVQRSPDMLRIAVRRIHHSMFYKPVGPLLEEALALVDVVRGSDDHGLYQELVFLIGGNLGVLAGDPSVSKPWLDLAMSEARDEGSVDLEARVIRKQADLMCLEGRYTDALEAIEARMNPEGTVSTRYQVYLLGALGEVCRHLDRPAQAVAAFEGLQREAVRRGIHGWEAHAHLGMSLLLSQLGDWDGASARVGQARQIYDSIGQAWGRLNSGIVEVLIERGQSDLREGHLERLLDEATSLGYGYESAVVRRLLISSLDPDFHLLFL